MPSESHKGDPLKRRPVPLLEVPDGPIQTRAIDANGLPIQLGFDGGWHHPDEFAARFRRRNLVREASRAVKDVDAGRFAKFWMARAMLEAAQ